MNKKVVFGVLNRLLQLIPWWMVSISAALACILYPQMNKVIIVPGKKFYRVYWKGKVFFAPSREVALLFMKPRPFQRWLRINKGDVVFEGGSAIGEDTVRIAEIVGPEGKVFAVEPNPVNLVFLKVNVRAFRNVEIIEKGVWNCKAELHFLQRGTLSSSILELEREKEGRIVKITVDSIDNMVGSHKVDILKLNIEGAEIEALEGAKQTLKTVREVLIAAHHIRNGEYTAQRVVNILRSEGFHAKIVHGIFAHHYVVARRITDDI